MTDLLQRAAQSIVKTVMSPAVIATTITAFTAAVALALYERRAGRDWRARYASRAFVTDVLYSIFYNTGIFALVWYPLYRALSALMPHGFSLRDTLHPAAHFVLFLVISDFGLYWKHRLMHAVPALWRIHAVHHSQTEMTLMTSYRFHFADELLANIVRFATGLLLGVPLWTWLPATIALTLYQSFQHSDTGWTFGPADRIFVSSGFHNVHHSARSSESQSNFGLFFSAWDHLFGTARPAFRPERYGVDDPAVPPSFFAQLWFPFARRRSRADAPPMTSAPAPSK